MTYSVSVSAATRDEVRAAALKQFDEATRPYPVHQKDQPAFAALLDNFLALVEPKDGFHISVYASGHIAQGLEGEITGISLNMQVSLHAPGV